jgi:phage protein D
MPVRVPFFQVRLEGEDVTPWIDSVSVTEDDRQADSVSLTIPDSRFLYSDALFEGSAVEVDLGYREANQHALMLRGMVTAIETQYPENGVPTVTVKAEDRSIEMGLEERNVVWRDRTVTDIVREVAGSYGFVRVEARLSPDPMIDRKPIHQDGKTDLAFLQELANQYHAKCFVELDEQDREVLFFIPEDGVLQTRRPDRLLLRYRSGPGSNLISFTPRFDSSFVDRLRSVNDIDQDGQPISSADRPPPEPVIWALDPARVAQASARDRTRIQQLYASGTARKLALQERLDARRPAVGETAATQADIESTNDTFPSQRLGMSGSGTTFGSIWMRAKSIVFTDGLAERFNGEWYVSSVTHRVDRKGYQSDFRCRR